MGHRVSRERVALELKIVECRGKVTRVSGAACALISRAKG